MNMWMKFEGLHPDSWINPIGQSGLIHACMYGSLVPHTCIFSLDIFSHLILRKRPVERDVL